MDKRTSKLLGIVMVIGLLLCACSNKNLNSNSPNINFTEEVITSVMLVLKNANLIDGT